MPGGDLMLPAEKRAAQKAHFDGAGAVLEVLTESLDEDHGQVGIVVVMDAAYDLLGVPGDAHLAAGIAGVEQAEQLRPAVVLQAFVGPGEQAAGSIQRVVSVATVAERLVLHPPPALVQLGVGELHQVKRIGDLDRLGQHRVEHRTIGTREIQGGARRRARATLHLGRQASDRALQRCDQARRRAGARADVNDRVDQHCWRHGPWGQNSVSSSPRAVGWPMRSG